MHQITLPNEEDTKFNVTLPDGKQVVLDAFEVNMLQAEAHQIAVKNKEPSLIPHFCSLFNSKYKTKISQTAAVFLLDQIDLVTLELKKKLTGSPESADSSQSDQKSPELVTKS